MKCMDGFIWRRLGGCRPESDDDLFSSERAQWSSIQNSQLKLVTPSFAKTGLHFTWHCPTNWMTIWVECRSLGPLTCGNFHPHISHQVAFGSIWFAWIPTSKHPLARSTCCQKSSYTSSRSQIQCLFKSEFSPRILYIMLCRFNNIYYGPKHINSPCTNPPLQEVLPLSMTYYRSVDLVPPLRCPTLPPSIILLAHV